MFKNMKLGTKLLAVFLAVGVIPLLAIAVLSAIKTTAALQQSAFDQLVAVREIKQGQIEDYIGSLEGNVNVLTGNPSIQQAMESFDSAFLAEGMKTGGFIWQDVRNEYGPTFESMQKVSDYVDIALVTTNGDVIYTVREGAELGQNVRKGELKDTGLGQAFSKAVKGGIGFADFKPYAPSDGEPAAFMAGAIERNGKIVGVMAVQISLHNVNNIMAGNAGMGQTGKVYLVGPLKMALTDPHHLAAEQSGNEESAKHIWQRVESEAVNAALSGAEGHKIIDDHLGNTVLSAYTPVKVKDSTWALAAEVDKDEAFAPVRGMISFMALIGAAGLLGIIVVAILMARAISRPLVKGAAFATAVAEGDFSGSLDIKRRDEIGAICNALSQIPETLKQLKTEFDHLVNDIDQGRLLNRSDDTRFKGAFAELIEGSNRIADELVGYMDNLPVLFMTMDKDHNVLFVNDAGAKSVGYDPKDVIGKKCYEAFSTPDCNTDRCACARAMKSLAKEHAETSAQVNGNGLEIKYMGVPNVDKQGNVIGACEIVIDQTEIKRSQDKIKSLAEESIRISEQVSSASQELAAQVEQASQGAEEQKGRASETATAMEEMNANVVEIAQNASNAAENAEKTKERANHGAEIVKQAAQAINQVQELSENLRVNMAELGEKAESIGKVMNVISDIADQTNLLALNAAIEAARAGDAGRGFAVVADEVRKLAEKTMTATTEVGNAIKSIQEVAEKNVQATQSATEAVAQSTELANQSGEALSEIVKYSEDTSDQVRAIAAASEQQSAASDEVSRSSEEINRISSETYVAMEESSKAIHDLARLANELRELIQQMQS